ncbi:MAG: S-layer domain protein [Thermotogales bacterium 46_20]|nr:MAG: S-layer domain protein [Thermotogales bacterium 46_20]
MRKLAVVIALVLLLAVASFANYQDVDPDHWAYESVMNVTNAGLFEGYPDGTFKGNQAMTRYEYAMVVNRFLRYVDSADSRLEELIYAHVGTGVPANIAEFEGKLNAQAQEILALKRRVTDLEVTTKLLGQSIAKQATSVAALEKEIVDLAFSATVAFDQIDANIARLDMIEDRIEDVKADFESTKGNYDELISTTALDVYRLSRGKADKTTVDALAARLATLETELDDITFTIFDFMDANTDLTFSRIRDLEDQIAMLESSINGVRADLDDNMDIIFDFMDANTDLTFSRIHELEESIAAIEGEFEELDAKIESNTDFLYRKISIVDEDNKKAIDSLNASVGSLDDGLRTVRRDLTDLSVTVKMLGQASSVHNTRIADNRADLNVLRLDMEELADLTYDLSDEVTGLSKLTYMMLDVFTEELEELDAKKADKEDLAALEDDVSELRSKTESFGAAINVATIIALIGMVFSTISLFY